MGQLEALFDRGTDGNCHKWRHYFEIYERYMGKFVGQKCTYLEIGVQRGGSLSLMQDYLGKDARIVGVDINPECAKLSEQGREIHIGSQADVAFLTELTEKTAPYDIVIDDGGHTNDQQLTSFFALFPRLNYGGVYIVEDTHANFWQGYQDSRFGISFYDFAKGLVEKLSLWHMDQRLFNRYHLPPEERQGNVQINNFALNEIFGIHFYDSIIVFEKRKMGEPYCQRR